MQKQATHPPLDSGPPARHDGAGDAGTRPDSPGRCSQDPRQPGSPHEPGQTRPPATRIRTARAADDDAIIRLLIETFNHLYTSMGSEMSPERRSYLGDQATRRGFATSFIYEVDGEIVGTITITPPSSNSEAWVAGAWDVRLLAVDARMQGRGVAKVLIRHAEDQARTAGATVMCLHARRGVANQARLYLGSGYARDPNGDLDGPPFQDGYRKTLQSLLKVAPGMSSPAGSIGAT